MDPRKPTLSAPSKAQKAHAALRRKGLLGQLPGFMAGRKAKKAKREARPHAPPPVTAAAPTVERKYKEPYGWEKTTLAGEQVQHRPRVFLEVYQHHIRDAGLVEAAELLQRAYETAGRVRITSDRAYSGMPFAGGAPSDRVGHAGLTQQDRADLEMLARTVDKLTRVNPVWWNRLKDHILREPDAAGRFASVNELGASITNYKRGTDNATAAGVTAVIDALVAFEIARQESAIELHMRDEKRRAELRRVLEEHAKAEREKRRLKRAG